MPKALDDKVKARGGARKVRTVRIGPNKYAHVFVVPKPGPRGGHTELGEVKKRKRRRARAT